MSSSSEHLQFFIRHVIVTIIFMIPDLEENRVPPVTAKVYQICALIARFPWVFLIISVVTSKVWRNICSNHSTISNVGNVGKRPLSDDEKIKLLTSKFNCSSNFVLPATSGRRFSPSWTTNRPWL